LLVCAFNAKFTHEEQVYRKLLLLLVQAANKMAYHNVDKFATLDAMRVGRLHTHLPGWQDANVAFMRSGGYSISARIPHVQQEALVLWGRQDQILEPQYASQFQQALPKCTLQWIEDCGHCGHLEQAHFTADAILRFAGVAGSSQVTVQQQEEVVNVPA
jgi:pimeloyl-ACP methyl ester carboxylesterase